MSKKRSAKRGKKQVPHSVESPETSKTVPEKHSIDALTKYQEGYFRFSVDQIDLEAGEDTGCLWQWGPEAHHWRDVLQHLADFSHKTWSEIEAERTGGNKRRRKKHHDMPVRELDKSARKRIRDLFGDDAPDTLFRFRLSGKQRLWGVRDKAMFYLLWFDEEHMVYPIND